MNFATRPTVNRSPSRRFNTSSCTYHPRFINQFGQLQIRDLLGQFYGDRARFYKMQPYVIALYMAKGIPMLWNGQEFGENWGVPNWGIGRNLFERPLHWEYFYDAPGKALVRLHRILGTLRRTHRALRSRGYFFYYYDQTHLQKGVIAFRRDAPADGAHPSESMIICLNFFDNDAEVWLPFPTPGLWVEQLDGIRPPVQIAQSDQWAPVIVPSNYGGIYKRT